MVPSSYRSPFSIKLDLMMKRLILIALSIVGLGASANLLAQTKPFEFGPPLRPNIVFSYKFTERVSSVYESAGAVVDSGQRILTYYVSERQLPLADGRWQIEANIDSMRVEYTNAGTTLRFNTQEAASEHFDINHREILAPSALVNRVAMITISPYGEILEIESPSFDFLREQIEDPAVDAVTRERVLDLISPEFIGATMLPWRSIVPLGRKVTYNDTLRLPFAGVLDRISVRDTAEVVLTRMNDAPVLSFTSTFSRATRPKAAFTELLDPLAISAVNGRVAGSLTLDEDGVVVSGWTATKGTVTGTISGAPVVATVVHETFTETIGMMSFIN